MASQRELVGGGRLTIEEIDGRVCFYAVRSQDNRGLYKVWVCGRGGRMLLGTMIPQENQLQLSRTLSRNTLYSAGCYPVTGGEVVLAFSFQGKESPPRKHLPPDWKHETHPEQWVQDTLLKDSFTGLEVLLKKSENFIFLASPYRVGEEFPILPLFCLARWELIGGKGHLVWKFDENGRVLLWDNS